LKIELQNIKTTSKEKKRKNKREEEGEHYKIKVGRPNRYNEKLLHPRKLSNNNK